MDEEEEMSTVTHHYIPIVDYVHCYVMLFITPLCYVRGFTRTMKTELLEKINLEARVSCVVNILIG